MPRPKRAIGQRTPAAPEEAPADGGSAGQEGANPAPANRSERTARLIADGRTSFPEGLGPAEVQALVTRVRALRRDRLVRYLARTIALDIRADEA